MASETASTSAPNAVIDNTVVVKQEDTKSALSDAQRAKIERNRQKALLLKQARLTSRPVSKKRKGDEAVKVRVPPKVIDTGGGFLLEEDPEDERDGGRAPVVHQPGAILDPSQLICDECEKEFLDSYLFDKFSCTVCDSCRDNDEKHKLITKSDAKSKYLLKDCDFDKREPSLAFILKKNPRNPRWGDMKLYLESQVYKRAMEVWESEEKLEEAMEKRGENKEKMKQNRYEKKMKELRKAVRSSLYRRDTSKHEHEYGEETYDEAEDTYSNHVPVDMS